MMVNRKETLDHIDENEEGSEKGDNTPTLRMVNTDGDNQQDKPKV